MKELEIGAIEVVNFGKRAYAYYPVSDECIELFKEYIVEASKFTKMKADRKTLTDTMLMNFKEVKGIDSLKVSEIKPIKGGVEPHTLGQII